MSEPGLSSTRLPQNDDSLGLLLAKGLTAPYARSTYIPSTGSVTTQTTGTTIDCRALRSLFLALNVSAISGGTLAVQVQYQDPVSGSWHALFTANPGISVAGTYTFVVGECSAPSNATVPGGLFPCRLPASLRMALVPSGATYTASLGLETT